MLAVRSYAPVYPITPQESDGIVLVAFLVVLAAIVIGYLIWIYWSRKTPYELSKDGWYYSTHRAHRITGCHGHSVINGKLSGWMWSLWRTYDGNYFLLHITEIKPAEIKPLLKTEAQRWINNNIHADLARDLLRDWFTTRSNKYESSYGAK